MAEDGEKRDPVTHRTPKQIKRHSKGYQATEEQKANRAKRNAARAEMLKKGKVKKGDGKDVDHTKKLKDGGSNASTNLRVRAKSKNRGDT